MSYSETAGMQGWTLIHQTGENAQMLDPQQCSQCTAWYVSLVDGHDATKVLSRVVCNGNETSHGCPACTANCRQFGTLACSGAPHSPEPCLRRLVHSTRIFSQKFHDLPTINF